MSLGLTSRRAALMPGQWVRNELWRRARAVPSLDLRFADNKSLVDAITGASLVTFTRASSATYVDSQGVIQTAATDVPRFDHNPTTGESLGLLVEEQRTNLLLQSNGFNTTWQNTNSSETAASGTAPDGTNTAWELKDTSDVVLTAHSLFQTYTGWTSGTAYTMNCWMKAGTLGEGGFVFPSSAFSTTLNCRFNLSTGATIFASAAIATSSVIYSNGWIRFSATATATTTASGTISIRSMNGNASYIGTGTGTILLWGADLKAETFPTSYIPTTTAAATRSADVASFLGTAFSSWYRQDEGTMFAEVAITQPASGSNQFILCASDNSSNNSIAMNVQSSGFASIATSSGGVSDGLATSAAVLTANTFSKIAAAYIVNNLGVSLNGSVTAIDTSATIPTALSRADIGSDHIATNQVKAGTIRRLTYWPQRFPATTLEAITQ